MRLNWHLRGIDLVDLELHLGSKGLYVDLSLFQPSSGESTPDEASIRTTADLSGSAGGQFDHAENIVRPDTFLPGGAEPPAEDRGPRMGFARR